MESIWTQSASLAPRQALDHNLETDVVVIGAGHAGVLTAWFLQQRGLNVVVLEANGWAAAKPRIPRPRSPPNTG